MRIVVEIAKRSPRSRSSRIPSRSFPIEGTDTRSEFKWDTVLSTWPRSAYSDPSIYTSSPPPPRPRDGSRPDLDLVISTVVGLIKSKGGRSPWTIRRFTCRQVDSFHIRSKRLFLVRRGSRPSLRYPGRDKTRRFEKNRGTDVTSVTHAACSYEWSTRVDTGRRREGEVWLTSSKWGN